MRFKFLLPVAITLAFASAQVADAQQGPPPPSQFYGWNTGLVFDSVLAATLISLVIVIVDNSKQHNIQPASPG